MVEKSKLLIGGEWVESSESFTVAAPFTGETLSEVSSADSDQLHQAIASAEEGARRMRSQARFQVAGGLRRIADGINSRKAEFAQTIAKEAAKPIKLARGEVERAISTFS